MTAAASPERHLEREEERAYRLAARAWLAEHVPPGWGTQDYVSPTSLDDPDKLQRWWQRTLFDGGYAGITWPTAYGGRGLTLLEEAILREESDYIGAPDVHVTGPRLVGPMLLTHGTEEQRQRYLPPILRGEEIWCQGYSEPDAGSDLAALRTRADLHGDTFVISGQKVWTSRAHHAELMIILARTDASAERHRGLSAIIVPLAAAGVSIRPIEQIDGQADFNEVFLDNVEVPVENLVGELHGGWQVAMNTLAEERVVTTRAFQAFRLLDHLVESCRAPQTDGGPPLIDDTIVRDGLAELFCQVHAAQATYFRSVQEQLRRGTPGPGESVGKLHTCELMQDITQFALAHLDTKELRSRVGHAAGHPPSWAFEYTTARRYTISAGTSQIMRNIIGERVLGLPRGS